MNLLIFPGNSSNNKQWAEKMAYSLRDDFSSIHVQNYEHWKSGKEIIDINLELDRLAIQTGQDYIILAKSVGIALALKAIQEGVLSPSKCIFMGFPLKWCQENNIPIEKWLENYNIPTLFIQQKDDPFLSFSELNSFLEKKALKDCSLKEISGNDHSYSDFSKLKELIGAFG